MPDRLARLRQDFQELFGGSPAAVVKGPGRVELLGNHTDYNEGFVLPIAIDRAVYVAASPVRAASAATRRVRLYSDHFRQTVELDLANITRDETAPWSNYVRGVALELQQAGHTLCGVDAALVSTVPVSSGVSSSAALELSVCLALTACAGLELDRLEMARLCQRAENEFVGMRCGILDQYSSAFGRRDQALLLDCRSLTHQEVPLSGAPVVFVVLDTKKPRPLVASAYNERRAQCEEAVRLLAEVLPGVGALRDVSPEDLERHQARLPETVRRRARHVVGENDRVLRAAERCRAGDMPGLGRLQHESQASLRDLYEVSCPELEAITSAAERHPACYGSRLVGAGFGGCAIATVAAGSAEDFIAFVTAEYVAAIGHEPEVYATTAAQGAEVLT